MTAKQATASVFGGGIPTEPDVKKLNDTFGIPPEGSVIEYAEVERVLGLSRMCCRFKTVTNAWRKRMEQDHRVWLMVVENVGYRAANPAERVDSAGAYSRKGFKAIRTGGRIASATDLTRLQPEERKRCEHIAKLDGVLRLAEKTAAKALPS